MTEEGNSDIPGAHPQNIRLAAYRLQQICGPVKVYRDCVTDVVAFMSNHQVQEEVTLGDIDVDLLDRWIEHEESWNESNVSTVSWDSFRRCRPYSVSSSTRDHRIGLDIVQSYLDLVVARAEGSPDTLPSVFLFPVCDTREALLVKVAGDLALNEGFPSDVLSRDIWLVPLLDDVISVDHVRAAAIDLKRMRVYIYDSYSVDDMSVKADMKVGPVLQRRSIRSRKAATFSVHVADSALDSPFLGHTRQPTSDRYCMGCLALGCACLDGE